MTTLPRAQLLPAPRRRTGQAYAVGPDPKFGLTDRDLASMVVVMEEEAR